MTNSVRPFALAPDHTRLPDKSRFLLLTLQQVLRLCRKDRLL